MELAPFFSQLRAFSWTDAITFQPLRLLILLFFLKCQSQILLKAFLHLPSVLTALVLQEYWGVGGFPDNSSLSYF